MSGTERPSPSAYADFLQRIAADNLQELRQLTVPEVRFKDPFNDVRGQDSMIAVFADVFKVAKQVRFRVRDMVCREGLCFLLWDFECWPKRSTAPWAFQGVSEVRFDQAGLVTEHIDHFDAGSQFYARLPLLGALIRLVRRRLEHKG